MERPEAAAAYYRERAPRFVPWKESLADHDADLLRALGGQLIDDHRAVPSAARADQPPDTRLTGAAPPHPGDHGARKDYLDRAVQRLLKDAEQQRGPPLQRDERARVEDASRNADLASSLWATSARLTQTDFPALATRSG